jgi:ATP-dependent Clp endopeptidase proteolytic subunit ClpP
MPRSWFEIKNAAADDVATVTIFDEIGYWGITAADFNREFRAIKAPTINLEINSPGGSVFDGIAIYNMLKASGKTINGSVMGVAASIASVILMACTKITMPANAMVMVHSPSSGVWGTAVEMRDMADVLDKISASLVATYVKRTGKTEDEVKAMLAKDTWMTADEAKANGFADEVTDSIEVTAKFDMERIPEAARAAFKPAQKAPVAKVEDNKPAVSFVDQVVALATAAGFQAHAPLWAGKFKTADEVTARIAEAVEITALCKLVNKADEAVAFIKDGKTLAEVSATLVNAAAADDKQIDTSTKNDGDKSTNKVPTVSSVWDKRNQRNQPINKDAGQSAEKKADPYARRRMNTNGA